MTPARKNKFPFRGPRRAPVQTDLGHPYREQALKVAQLIQQHKWEEAKRLYPSGKTYRVFSNGRPRGFLTSIGYGHGQEAQKIESIVKYLQARGIPVPRITRIDPPEFIEFESGGKTLRDALTQLRSRKKNQNDFSRAQWAQKRKMAVQWLGRVFRMMGKVHALGIVHHHPHSANIILTKEKPGLIDFKFAETIDPAIWKSPAPGQQIWNAFNKDYFYLKNVLKMEFGRNSPFGIKESSKEMRAMAWRLFRPYPCSESVKHELVNRFMREMQ